MSQYSYMQDNRDNTGSLFAQYPTPDSTQPLTNNSQSQPKTQIVDSFLSDIPQGAYSEYSTIPSESIDLTPHTPESLLCSPAPDVSLGDERTDLNSRKQRRSPRIASNQTQIFEQQSDSNSLKSQDSLNNRELITKNPAALALEVLNESGDLDLLQQILSERERNTLNSRNLDSPRMENLRDLITTSNMMLDSVHHSSVSFQNQELDDEMGDIECMQKGTNETLNEVSHEDDNEYPESDGLVIANEISDTLLRQSEHYNTMASKFSNLKFIKVQPENEEEIEQFVTPITPGLRRSTRKRTMANYSYPRYSYGGGRRSRTRKRSRSFRKVPLSIAEDEAGVDSEVINVDNERSEETDGPMYNLSPVQNDEEQEAYEDSYGIQGTDDSRNVDENILDNESQGNLYLKHDLRSRKIMLELLEGVAEGEEIEKEPVPAYSSKKTTRSKQPAAHSSRKTTRSKQPAAYSSKKTTRSKQPAKKPILKTTFKKSAKTIPKRRMSRRSTSRKKHEDSEWQPDEVDSELDDDNEAVTTTPRGRRAISKTRLSSKAYITPKKAIVESTDVISEVSNTKGKISRRSTSHKKNDDREWQPDEVDGELDDDNETVMTTPRGRRAISKTHLSSKAYTTPKKAIVENTDVISEVSNTKRLSIKKTIPKITKTSKTTKTTKTTKATRKGKQPTQSNRGRGKGRGRTRGSRSKNRDAEYIYSGEGETESGIETTGTVDMVNDNSENHIVRGSSVDMDVEMDDVIQDENVVIEPLLTPARPKRTQKGTKSSISEPLIDTPSRSTRGRDSNKRGGRKDAGTQIDDDAVSNIHEPSDNETANVPEVQVDLIPATQPKKTTRSTRDGGKTKGQGGRVSDNTATDQPLVPTPGIVEISSESQTTLTNAVRVLTEKNFDLVHSPENIASIEEIRSPVLVRPHSTPPPESQAIQTQSPTYSSDWSQHHWSCLKKFYDETKSEYLQSEDLYREVTKKFKEIDINNRTFEEEYIRVRINALEEREREREREVADSEKSSEPSGITQRRSSIESSSSKGSRSSSSHDNKAYSNLRNGTKRKRSELNAAINPEGKKEDNGETKVPKRHRVEGNTPSGSGATTPSHDMNVSQTSSNNSIFSFSRIFGGWFRSQT